MRNMTRGASMLLVLALAGYTAIGAAARHDVLYPGTVLEVQAEKIRIDTVDPDTKEPAKIWFTVTEDTKIKRGDTPLPWTDARIVADERIVVVVNHEAEVAGVATELRLAVRGGPAASPER